MAIGKGLWVSEQRGRKRAQRQVEDERACNGAVWREKQKGRYAKEKRGGCARATEAECEMHPKMGMVERGMRARVARVPEERRGSKSAYVFGRVAGEYALPADADGGVVRVDGATILRSQRGGMHATRVGASTKVCQKGVCTTSA